MKKKFFVLIGGVAIIAGIAFNFSFNSNNGSLSDLALANVTALAQSESGHYGTCGDDSGACEGQCPICNMPLKGTSGKNGPLKVTGTDGCHAH